MLLPPARPAEATCPHLLLLLPPFWAATLPMKDVQGTLGWQLVTTHVLSRSRRCCHPQGRESSYTLTETRIGGSLSRHDLSIEQLGEATQSQVGLAARVRMAPVLCCGCQASSWAGRTDALMENQS